jgi:hypothetical protein
VSGACAAEHSVGAFDDGIGAIVDAADSSKRMDCTSGVRLVGAIDGPN